MNTLPVQSEPVDPAAASFFSEASAEPGVDRPHWGKLASLRSASLEDLQSRHDAVRRHLDELGVTYNVYADSQGQERPWQVDLFPLLIPPAEWAAIEKGLIQRTRLLNTILRDLYGEQSLLQTGVLPADLVFGSPSFLRPCKGMPFPAGFPLVLHGVDLARKPDGTWCVISDRTQAPSGLGYALANRMVLSRNLPDEFRSSQVQRLAGFFMALRTTLLRLAPEGSASPSVAVLTPGAFNETHFEHAFLARYLGLALVEGADLLVRDRQVFIKTLDGLRRVDVLLRRVDDEFCDPIDLKADSCLGVPGLVDAARSGNVSLVNSLGSAWLESAALNAFLPRLCQTLFGEDLLLPNLQSWWCGDPASRAYVRENLDQLIVKHSFRPAQNAYRYGAKLDPEDRERLLREIEFSPFDFTAQEFVSLSRAPCLQEGSVEERPVVLRAFVCASPDGCFVLPGGLTRVATSARGLIVSMQSGGVSKDTWVLSDAPVSSATLLRPAFKPIRLESAPAEVPSRVADNLFWLGRYAERLEDLCRIMRCLLNRLAIETDTEQSPEIVSLVLLLVKLDLLPERFVESRTLAGVEREAVQFIFQAHKLGTVREVQSRLLNLVFSLRDRFSADTQRIVSLLNNTLRQQNTNRAIALGALEVLNRTILHLAAFSGMEMENMTRGHGWRFLDMGRRLERSINIVTLLQAGLQTSAPESTAILPSILEIADSSMTYRRRYLGQTEWATVIDLLIADESNPRSFQFQLNEVERHVQRLSGRAFSGSTHTELELLASIRADVNSLNLADFSEGGEAPSLETQRRVLAGFAASMRTLSDSLTRRYFVHTNVRPS